MEPLIIVVGTTPDYVTRIQEEERRKLLLFLLDIKFRHSRELAATDNSHFIFSDLNNYNRVLETLNRYISGQNHKPCFACFDCEALYLASRLAEHYNCPFPSSEAVLNSRNKFLSSRLWVNKEVPTPVCEISSNLADSLALFTRIGKNVVIKPLTGSGSELVFHCTNEAEIIKAVKIIEAQLNKRRNNPLFASIMDPVTGEMIDPCALWIVEEYIDGPEYSCDFFMSGDSVHILRETGKIKDKDYPFGTISGYVIPPNYSGTNTQEEIKTSMMKAANALGFTWGYFMADFIISNKRINMIELTPRPGGDSLPDLIKESTGSSILKTYLDIITEESLLPDRIPELSGNYASVHFFSQREGIITDIDAADIINDPQTRLLLLKKNKGDSVSLPPDDYDNRLLGYCVVLRGSNDFTLKACKEIQDKLKVTYSTPN